MMVPNSSRGYALTGSHQNHTDGNSKPALSSTWPTQARKLMMVWSTGWPNFQSGGKALSFSPPPPGHQSGAPLPLPHLPFRN